MKKTFRIVLTLSLVFAFLISFPISFAYAVEDCDFITELNNQISVEAIIEKVFNGKNFENEIAFRFKRNIKDLSYDHEIYFVVYTESSNFVNSISSDVLSYDFFRANVKGDGIVYVYIPVFDKTSEVVGQIHIEYNKAKETYKYGAYEYDTDSFRIVREYYEMCNLKDGGIPRYKSVIALHYDYFLGRDYLIGIRNDETNTVEIFDYYLEEKEEYYSPMEYRSARIEYQEYVDEHLVADAYDVWHVISDMLSVAATNIGRMLLELLIVLFVIAGIVTAFVVSIKKAKRKKQNNKN